MRSELPQEYKEGIFKRLINRIKSFFSKDKKENINKDTNIENDNSIKEKNTIIDKNNFMWQIKNDIDRYNEEIEKKRLMKRLDEEPELLDTFSNKKLEEIYEIYLEEIKKKEAILENLRKNNS